MMKIVVRTKEGLVYLDAEYINLSIADKEYLIDEKNNDLHVIKVIK